MAYRVVRNLERNVGKQTYESIAVSALEGAKAITVRKFQGKNVMASMLSYTFPDPSQWPFVALPGYIETAGHVAQLSSSTAQGLVMIVPPENATAFEDFALQTYNDRGYPETAGRSEFGFGIWARDKNSNYTDGRVRDVNGTASTYDSKYNTLAVIFEINIPNAKSRMFNVHSDVFRGPAIESILDCAEEARAVGNTEAPPCSVLTDFIELIIRPGPAALLYGPVYPANDLSKVVAFTGTSFNWAEVLTNVVPDYVNGLVCVISNGMGDAFTYVIENGEPILLGAGDQHDSSFDPFARQVVLNDQETGASASMTFTLTVYPTNVMFDAFRSDDTARTFALGFIAIISLCGLLFLLYDFFMRHESRQRQIILESKRRFVRFISHEIRTPLNTVCMGVELLEAEVLSGMKGSSAAADNDECSPLGAMYKNWLDLISDIRENSESAVSCLNDVLNYDKLEAGSFRLEVTIVDIWELIQKTVSAFEIQAKKKNVKLCLTMPRSNHQTNGRDVEDVLGLPDFNLLQVHGDDMRLRQVVRNLISNGLKFCREVDGEVTVTVECVENGLPASKQLTKKMAREISCCDAPRAGAIRCSVQDNGAGMTQEQLAELFQEGIQFDVNKLQHGGGSGLGLYITKGLIEEHGGIIFVHSDGPSLGTKFTFELPLHRFPSSVEAKTSTTESVQNGETSKDDNFPEKSRRVLVVDDVLPNCKMLVRLLERCGHICATAMNGREAIEVFSKDAVLADSDPTHVPFDTILMDFEMPVLNGPDATRELRESGCKAWIVGVTGNVLAEDVSYFKSMGADDVIPKPVQVSRLQDFWLQNQRKED